MTCCASISPIIFCCGPPMRMPPRACWTSAACPRCSPRVQGKITHKPLDHVSPLAVPALLEIGREMIHGEASEALLAEAEEDLIREAMS